MLPPQHVAHITKCSQKTTKSVDDKEQTRAILHHHVPSRLEISVS